MRTLVAVLYILSAVSLLAAAFGITPTARVALFGAASFVLAVGVPAIAAI